MTAARVRNLQYATGIGLLLFWLAFFTVGLAPAAPPAGYFQFEHSFTVPDILLACALIVSAWWQSQADDAVQRRGRVLAVACGGALLFLGALDISFNLQNGMYRGAVGDAVGAVLINAWCLYFGTVLVRSAMPASTGTGLVLALAMLPADGTERLQERFLTQDDRAAVVHGSARAR